MTDGPVKTRFAPSPSGHLHVGGARTALFCWAFARGRDGQFLLRIEDTDQQRSSDEAVGGFQQDMQWLGIGWDEGPEWQGCGGGDAGPYCQSARNDIYDTFLADLLDRGLAYRGFETTEELASARAKARKAGKPYRYERPEVSAEDEALWLAEGRPHVVRFAVSDESVTVSDTVLGDVTTEASEVDDFVIQKADGFPTYHLAVVVDDELMGVTHVIRGQEHLNNTPRHVLLQDALGFRRPVYAHISLIFNPDGSKMSKRDRDKALRAAVREAGLDDPPPHTVDGNTWKSWLASKDVQLGLADATALAHAIGVELPEIDVRDFRRAGYLPEVLVNYLALLGWSPGNDVEQFDKDFLVEHFSLERIVKSPAKFDRQKLLAFNLDAIQAMPHDLFADRLRSFCEDWQPAFLSAMTPEQFDVFARSNKERSKTLADPVRTGMFFVRPASEIQWPNVKGVRKALCKGSPCGYERLEAVRPVLALLDAWTTPSLEATVSAWAQEHCDGKLGMVAQPLRVAVSGGTVSPPIFDTLAILGQDEVMDRIDRCLANRLPEPSGT
ncbi:MAG: glutamate--tRNA ligase [Phycisphaerales bacterium]|jgi:glutamyl-tRNA synthetase|nr:glutamate--tRNA ligase [Phycisphaerales bacterium]